MTTDPWGIDDGYWDVHGSWHPTPPDTRAALRAAMGGTPDDPDRPPSHQRPVWVVRAGDGPPLHSPAELTLEDGTVVRAEAALPPDLPIGYHDLRPLDEGPVTRLILTPGRCHLPHDLHTWMLAVQLPTCRSARSWGIGDLADLKSIGAWAAERGAGMVGVSPLHAPLPIDQVQPSPYFPSSRRWSNPLLLRIEDLPGTSGDDVIAGLARQGRVQNDRALLDRDAVWALKRRALEHLWDKDEPDPRFAPWRAEQGDELETYARFCALAEHHGAGWSRWPVELQHPDNAAVARFAADRADRVRFWAWIQFLLVDQLRRAEVPLPLLTDLAIGVDPDGADAWALQDLLALGVRVGAPPDEFNRAGQDWGLPPFDPHALREAAYAPLASLWRAALGRRGGLRIDHVMGLFRLFWIPPGGGPADGAYVRYPGHELLATLAIESVRAGAVVVGEDLGTVEDGVRHALGQAGVLSYRVAWFEDGPPEHYPAQSLAAVTTHDLPTIAGVWTGEDGTDQRAAGIEPDTDALGQLRDRLKRLAEVDDDTAIEGVVERAYAHLAQAPSALVAATLEDMLAVTRRPNLPGTTDERPNWSIGLPMPLEDVLAAPLANRVTDVLSR